MNSRKSYLCRDHSAIIKGVLTLLIVLGHDIVFTIPTDFIGIMSFLYLFHIQCFFILPFLYGISSEAFSVKRTFSLIKRFYWPYCIFVILLAIIYGSFSGFKTLSLIGIIKALLFGGTHLKSVCGISILWFLPSMMCTMFLRELYYRMGKIGKSTLLIISILYNFIVIVNAIDSSMLQFVNYFKWMPFGSDYSIGILYMGVLSRWLYIKIANVENKIVLLSCLLVIFIVSITYFSFIVPATINYAAHPLYKIISRFSPIAFFIFLCIVCGYIRTENVRVLLSTIGNKSLYIYLISPFVGYLMAFICINLNIISWYIGLLVWPLIVIISYYMSRMIRGKFEVLIFPK